LPDPQSELKALNIEDEPTAGLASNEVKAALILKTGKGPDTIEAFLLAHPDVRTVD